MVVTTFDLLRPLRLLLICFRAAAVLLRLQLTILRGPDVLAPLGLPPTLGCCSLVVTIYWTSRPFRVQWKHLFAVASLILSGR